jgi:hypothetical protein
VSVVLAATLHPEAKACFVLPLAVFVFVFVLARSLAPEVSAAEWVDDYSTLFSTAAQLTVTLLVALALELRAVSFQKPNVRRLIIGVTLVYVALGAAAAVVALNPGLSTTLYKWLFSLTLAAGGAALLSVLTISYRALKSETDDILREANRRG